MIDISPQKEAVFDFEDNTDKKEVVPKSFISEAPEPESIKNTIQNKIDQPKMLNYESF